MTIVYDDLAIHYFESYKYLLLTAQIINKTDQSFTSCDACFEMPQ